MGFFDSIGKALSNIDYDELNDKITKVCEQKQKDILSAYKKKLREVSDEQLERIWDNCQYEDNEMKTNAVRDEMERRYLL